MKGKAEKEKVIIDVSERIGNLRAEVREYIRKSVKMHSMEKDSPEYIRVEEEVGEDLRHIASEYKQLVEALGNSDPEELENEDLFVLWEALYGMNLIKPLPKIGALKNLKMLKTVSVERIRTFFNAHQLYTIGVDERPTIKSDGTEMMMTVDIVLEDDGSNKINTIGLPKEYVIVWMENGGIFVTLNAEDIPKLLATGAEFKDKRADTHRKLTDALAQKKN